MLKDMANLLFPSKLPNKSAKETRVWLHDNRGVWEHTYTNYTIEYMPNAAHHTHHVQFFIILESNKSHILHQQMFRTICKKHLVLK